MEPQFSRMDFGVTAVRAQVTSFRMLADGSLRYSLDVFEQDSKQALEHFSKQGTTVFLALATNGDGLGREQDPGPDDVPPEHQERLYGDQARVLRLSQFWYKPEVWKAIGTDAEFLAWLRDQKCAACNREPPSEAAHVRRIANGAGTGIKPEYSAIPLCHNDHRDQHQYGESKLFAKDGWDRLRLKYVMEWCWETIKKQLGYSSMADVPPQELMAWASKMGISQYLPSGYMA